MPARLKIEAGVRYGKYLVSVEEVPSTGRWQLWRFRCDCGKKTVKRASEVKRGAVASCGYCGLRHNAPRTTRHGHARPGPHGTRSPEYLSWKGMKARCSNPKQPNWRWYGGRGITVCDRDERAQQQYLGGGYVGLALGVAVRGALRDAEVSSGARLRHAQARNCARELARRHGAVALPNASLIRHLVFKHLGSRAGPTEQGRATARQCVAPDTGSARPAHGRGGLGENPGDPWGCTRS